MKSARRWSVESVEFTSNQRRNSTCSLAAVENHAASSSKLAVGIRINPNIEAGGHEYISTGKKSDKFGVSLIQADSILARAAAMPRLHVDTIALHIGSQIDSLERFATAFGFLSTYIESCQKRGFSISRAGLGGGLAAQYDAHATAPPSFEAFARTIQEAFQHRAIDSIALEPGRCLTANSGILVTRVTRIKNTLIKENHQNKNYFWIILDAAMNDLIRPALYGATHQIQNFKLDADRLADEKHHVHADWVGPICESADRFKHHDVTLLPEIGAWIALESAGAYGAVLASLYNGRALPAELMHDNGNFRVIRRALTRDQLSALCEDNPTSDNTPNDTPNNTSEQHP